MRKPTIISIAIFAAAAIGGAAFAQAQARPREQAQRGGTAQARSIVRSPAAADSAKRSASPTARVQSLPRREAADKASPSTSLRRQGGSSGREAVSPRSSSNAQADRRSSARPSGVGTVAPRSTGALGMAGPRERDRSSTSGRPRTLDRYDLLGVPGTYRRSEAGRYGFALPAREGHHIDRRWTVDVRRHWASGVRTRVQPYRYFRPDWRPYRLGWVDPRWNRWGTYWSWGGWRPYYWWRQPTWVTLTGWFGGFGWTASNYISYSYGESVIFRENYVYLNGRALAPINVYVTQAIQLGAVQVPVPPPPQTFVSAGAIATDWTPLGVFAVAVDENVDPNSFLQLAVSRQGFIGGTYYNQLTDQLLPIEGSVDRMTQRAAWRIGDNSDTVMEAGLYNLTQDQAPLLIHFGPTRTECHLLVRLQEPAQGQVPMGPLPHDVWSY